ncbi:hypothetical protein AK812_SmicGene34192 [Symbiodinium microadriaticum]|uniref:Uncharacterized protein n=1 Tax=Symbiodinium microadriaticum TaxID=2951 RepID=A0A1Q9CPM9_SYMMI|nr:hypothetical protein AK812_SmicGene34192 [Symbiodinium microadriaticum]
MDGVASFCKKHNAMKHEAISVVPTGSSEDHPFAVQTKRHNQSFPGRTNCLGPEEFQQILERIEHRESLPGHGHHKVCKARWFTVKDFRKRVCSILPRRSMPVSDLKEGLSTDAAL